MTNEIKLIDKYLPEFTFSEYHQIVVNSTIERTYIVAKDFDMSKSKLIKWLFKIRRLPTNRMNLQGFIKDVGFTNIEDNFPKENLIGFWARTTIKPITGYEDFVNNSISAKVKVVWNFYLERIDSHKVKLSTETRVLCLSSLTKFSFGLYWFVIKPFSGIIRNKMLQIIKQESEAEVIIS